MSDISCSRADTIRHMIHLMIYYVTWVWLYNQDAVRKSLPRTEYASSPFHSHAHVQPWQKKENDSQKYLKIQYWKISSSTQPKHTHTQKKTTKNTCNATINHPITNRPHLTETKLTPEPNMKRISIRFQDLEVIHQTSTSLPNRKMFLAVWGNPTPPPSHGENSGKRLKGFERYG